MPGIEKGGCFPVNSLGSLGQVVRSFCIALLYNLPRMNATIINGALILMFFEDLKVLCVVLISAAL